MASRTEIINHALLRLGQAAIMNESDDSVLARQCMQEFDSALGALLRIHPWPFAMARKEMARLFETPVFGFSYYYQLPSDLARVVDIDAGGQAYQIEGKKLATNASAVKIRYVSTILAVENMDEVVATALALDLASRLAIIVTENQQLKSQLYEEYNLALTAARGVWAVEDYPQLQEESSWIVARRMGPRMSDIWNPWGADGMGVKQ